MTAERATGYTISVQRSRSSEGWVSVKLRKWFWSPPSGTRSRAVAETGFYAMGMSEQDIIASCLRELLRAYEDRLS